MNIINSIRYILESNSSVAASLNAMAGQTGSPTKSITFPKPTSISTSIKKIPSDTDGNHTTTTVTKVAGLIGKNPKKLFQPSEW